MLTSWKLTLALALLCVITFVFMGETSSTIGHPQLSDEGRRTTTTKISNDDDPSPPHGTVARSEPSEQGVRRVHVHVIAVGDSLTEGGFRRQVGGRRLAFRPYSKALVGELARAPVAGSGDTIVGVTTQAFAFRGRKAAGVLYHAALAMFPAERSGLASPAAPPPLALRRVLSTSETTPLGIRDDPNATVGVDRVVVVCAVLVGTNDVSPRAVMAGVPGEFDARGVAVAAADVHCRCADYAQAILRAGFATASASVRAAAVMLLPISLPPMPLAESTPVMRRLIAAAAAAQGANSGARVEYCQGLSKAVVAASAKRHAQLNDVLVSPGAFTATLEDRVATRRAAADRDRKAFAVPEWVAKEVVPLDDRRLLPVGDGELWSDCLHPSVAGYDAVGRRIAAAIRGQL